VSRSSAASLCSCTTSAARLLRVSSSCSIRLSKTTQTKQHYKYNKEHKQHSTFYFFFQFDKLLSNHCVGGFLLSAHAVHQRSQFVNLLAKAAHNFRHFPHLSVSLSLRLSLLFSLSRARLLQQLNLSAQSAAVLRPARPAPTCGDCRPPHAPSRWPVGPRDEATRTLTEEKTRQKSQKQKK
jgi:hypothetical protein